MPHLKIAREHVMESQFQTRCSSIKLSDSASSGAGELYYRTQRQGTVKIEAIALILLNNQRWAGYFPDLCHPLLQNSMPRPA